MMNILQVCNKPPFPPHDGGSLASYSLMRAFTRLGHKVTLLTMCTPKHRLNDDDQRHLSELIDLHIIEVDTSISVSSLIKNLVFSKLPYNAERFIDQNFENELAGILKNGSFDIVQLEGLYLMPYSDTIRKHSKARIALRAHNIEYEIWRRITLTEKNLLKKLYFTILAQRLSIFEHKVVNQYDLLVPITTRDKDEFEQMGNTKPVYVCPAALDPCLCADPGPVEHLQSLFFLGSLEWKPNQEGLLWFIRKVFPGIRKIYPSLELHIAGRNAPDWLSDQLKHDGVFFHGEIPEAAPYIQQHGIMIAPCFSGGGMRLKIVEAMQYSKPVVTTPIGAEGLGVKSAKNILIGHSSADFVQHIDHLLKSPDFYFKIANNALLFVQKNFDNMKITEDLCEFYIKNLS